MEFLTLPKFIPETDKTYIFDVPASKSVAARALILAALSRSAVRIRHGELCSDTEEMLTCLHALGVKTEEKDGVLTVYGCGGSFPVRKADLYVGSAGTVARFLPAVLAFSRGEYRLDASEQMRRRPMNFLKELERAGAKFEFSKKEYSFPFAIVCLVPTVERFSRMVSPSMVSRANATVAVLSAIAAARTAARVFFIRIISS